VKAMNTKRTFIIAEAGVNHNGSLEIARRMVEAAADAGADAIKFQTFRTEQLAILSAPKAEYQKARTDPQETQFEMLKKLELNPDAYRAIYGHCGSMGIQFLSSPFDEESVDFLDQLGLALFKIPSGEITNLPYLRKIGRLRKEVILSTGMASLGEIEDALQVLEQSGTERGDITVLHCSTEYPASIGEVNLAAMLTVRDAFKVRVGYSDHTLGIEIAIAAVALGATIIEKHFTLNRTMPGPDHKASSEPQELKILVESVRRIEAALGDGIKRPTRAELKNRSVIRKSIVAGRPIVQGELLTEGNLVTRRPGMGINPMFWDSVIGKRAKKDFSQDEPIEV
jgi:N,N'-diacetyllegionaminate synthase